MSVANRPVHRPLSPHLQIYRPQLTSMLSILHRATGIALAVGALYLAVWVMCAAASPRHLRHASRASTPRSSGRFVLGGWLFCAFYHLCNGIRHLFWDAGYGFELKDAYRSGWIVVGVSLVATVAVVDRRPPAGLRRRDMTRSQNASRPRPRPRLGQGRRASLVGAARSPPSR